MKEIKKCSKCKKDKAFSEFGASKQTKDGLKCYCKECKRKESATWRGKNPDYNKTYRDQNRAEAIDYSREYYKENKEELYRRKKVALLQNPERQEADKKRKKSWYEANKDKVIDRKRERRHTNIQLRLAENLRARLYHALKNNSTNTSAVNDLGCSLEEFVIYIQSKFQDEMSWENYGEWHLDHVMPLSSFDLTIDEQVKKACHYTNLQPLWAEDNLKKGARISPKEEK